VTLLIWFLFDEVEKVFHWFFNKNKKKAAKLPAAFLKMNKN